MTKLTNAELDPDLQNEEADNDSIENRIERLLIQILRELKAQRNP